MIQVNNSPYYVTYPVYPGQDYRRNTVRVIRQVLHMLRGKLIIVLSVCLLFFSLFQPHVFAAGGATEADAVVQADDDIENNDWFDDEEESGEIADPLEPLNRVFFYFNDKLYFWVLKPVAEVYAVLDQDVRLCVRNGFQNLLTPVRLVNAALQGKVDGAAVEFKRFVINSTLGIAGLADPAGREFGLKKVDEDFGQTLGVYGLGEICYINWPILGPSSVRDSIGFVADSLLDPVNYLTAGDPSAAFALTAGKRVNEVSLTLGDYELFVETSMDPYAAVRDAYYQYRIGRIEDRSENGE
jgi:phospholipid-binding lipoprotein MlaA